ncbi:hypothetical protein N8198_09650, partial [Gammaproteobacteria bacterium]|nr:hypothetical protein [Gammaproteobacteria bacterium]
LESQTQRQRATIEKKDQRIARLRQSAAKDVHLIRKTQADLKGTEAKLARFARTGEKLRTRTSQRFTKMVVLDASGEILGWVPLVGDVASLGLVAGGIYEMCRLFEEIEKATVELGAPFIIYTDTFCDKPVGKTAELARDTGQDVSRYLSERLFYTKEYWRYKLQ